MEERWWSVKVYDEESQTYTTLSKFASSTEDIEDELKADGLWVFVSAEPEDE